MHEWCDSGLHHIWCHWTQSFNTSFLWYALTFFVFFFAWFVRHTHSSTRGRCVLRNISSFLNLTEFDIRRFLFGKLALYQTLWNNISWIQASTYRDFNNFNTSYQRLNWADHLFSTTFSSHMFRPHLCKIDDPSCSSRSMPFHNYSQLTPETHICPFCTPLQSQRS